MENITLSPILPGPLSGGLEDTTGADGRQAATADFESFLTLLTAQLRNQDPLSPLDSTEFVAQLASFSSVEQLVGTNERLDLMTKQALSGDIASFAAWIGREVSAIDGSFRASGEPIAFNVPTQASGERIEAIISDATTGSVLRQFTVTPDASGLALWDGEDQFGNVVAPRDLKLELQTFEGGTQIASVPGEVFRLVSGIRGTENGLILDLADGGTLAPDAVGRLMDGTAG